MKRDGRSATPPQQSADYFRECHDPEMAEYRDYLRSEGLIEEGCNHGYSTP
jgi:hypothetical protein